MKKKTIVNSIAFAITLLFSIAIVTTIFNKNTFSFFSKEEKIEARLKVYNFLLADKARLKKFSDRYGEQRAKLEKMTAGYTVTLSPEVKDRYLKEVEVIDKTQFDERWDADTSELPNDVRTVWSKMVTDEKSWSEINWAEANPEFRRELTERRNEEAKANDEEFRRVVTKYGFELDLYGLIIDKEG